MTARKRILFILHMPPPVHGSAVVGKTIHDSVRINREFDCRFINLATASDLGDIGKFKPGKISRFASLLKHIRREIKSFRPDLIYITPNSAGAAFYKDWLTVNMLKHTGIPVVAHFHNKGVSRNSNNALKRALYRNFFRDLNVILLSDRLFTDIKQYADRQRVYICHNGIADCPTPPIATHTKESRILFLSNLLVDKGILTLLDALKIISDRGIDFKCDIAGAETYDIDRDRLTQEINSRRLEGKAIYHGAVYGNDKEKLFNNASIMVFPTKNEAFPLVCIEAMAHSLAVITTDEGGIPDIVIDGQTGAICSKQCPEDIADKLSTMLRDSNLCTKMGQNGRKRFEKLFTIESFEHELIGILHKIS